MSITETQAAPAAEGQLVTFMLDGEEFGFDIMAVQEIIRLPAMSRIPHTPDYIEGVANLRGEVLPVLDMRVRFGLERVEATDRTRVLVLDLEGRKTGMKVDRVTQVSRFDRADMEPPPQTVDDGHSRFLRGIVKLDGGKRMVMALDDAAMGRAEARLDLQRAAAGAVAQAETTRATPTVEQMVTFRLGREEFALPMGEVREILRLEDPTHVPKSPPYLLGILTVRGNILPVVDLRSLLALPALADELQQQCDDFRVRLEGAQTRRQTEALVAEIHAWLGGLHTSSQVLMEGVARVWGHLTRCTRLLGQEDVLASRHELEANIAQAVTELARAFPRHVKDDQRIIVVEIAESRVGLVVDRVNEVLNVPAEALTDAPRLLQTHGLDTSRIARLDDGRRLIQVLRAAQLFPDQVRDEVTAHATLAPPTEARDAATADETQIVTFVLDGEEFGIPIAQVQEIDRHSRVSKVPRAPAFVHGVTNLRGDVIPVIDTRHCCRLPARTADDRTRVIIVDMDGSKTGLVVDSVREVLTIRRRDISPPPEVIQSSLDRSFLSGIARLDDGKRMIVLIDVGRILTREERDDLSTPTPDEPAAPSRRKARR